MTKLSEVEIKLPDDGITIDDLNRFQCSMCKKSNDNWPSMKIITTMNTVSVALIEEREKLNQISGDWEKYRQALHDAPWWLNAEIPIDIRRDGQIKFVLCKSCTEKIIKKTAFEETTK